MVPNDFHVELSPVDLDRLAPYDTALADELTHQVQDHADAQGYVFPGPIAIEFETADDLTTGRFRIRSRAPGPGAAATPPTRRYAGRARVLEINGTQHPLQPPGLVVGRGTEADVRINDPGVSRRHVEFEVSTDVATGARRPADRGPRPRLHQRHADRRPQGHQGRRPRRQRGPDRQHHDDRADRRGRRGRPISVAWGEPVSELTLFLIRIAYLAILWIFVLSAISVIRSDMFGARVPEAARGSGRRAQGPQGRQEAAAEAARLPDPRPGRRGQQRRRARRARAGADPDRPRHRRGDPARRRLRLDPARPDRRAAATSGSSRTSAPPTAPTSAPSASPSPPRSPSAPRSASARRSSS